MVGDVRYQFFLDSRDYLKYSLLEDFAVGGSFGQLTIIWLLTPDVTNGHGRRRPRFDAGRPDLNNFFLRDPRPVLPDVGSYFRQRGVPFNSYGDCPSQFLTAKNRAAYFAAIPREFLDNALVFFDPDNGLEPKSGGTTAHIRLAELVSVWARLGTSSALVVYQHKPRVPGSTFWPYTAARLAEALNTPVGHISSGDVGFLVAARRGNVGDLLSTCSVSGINLGYMPRATGSPLPVSP